MRIMVGGLLEKWVNQIVRPVGQEITAIGLIAYLIKRRGIAEDARLSLPTILRMILPLPQGEGKTFANLRVV